MGNCTDGVFLFTGGSRELTESTKKSTAPHTRRTDRTTPPPVSDSTSLPMTPHSPPTPLVDLLSDSQSGLEYLTDSEERKNLTAGTFLFVL